MKRIILALLLLLLSACGEKGYNYGPYSIGRDESWFPLQLESQMLQVTAFSTAVIHEIAASEHVPLELFNIDWVQIFELLDKGELAGILTPLPQNVITTSKYSFSDPMIELGPVLILPRQSEANSLSDLQEKIIAVYQFDESLLLVQKYPSIIIQLYQNKPQMLEDLSRGKVDAALMPILDAEALVPTLYPNQLKIVDGPLNKKAIRLITLKDHNSSLIKYFNRGLEKLRSSGKYAELRQTYGLD